MQIFTITPTVDVVIAIQNVGDLVNAGKMLSYVDHGIVNIQTDGTITTESDGETFVISKDSYVIMGYKEGKENRHILKVVESLKPDYTVIKIQVQE